MSSTSLWGIYSETCIHPLEYTSRSLSRSFNQCSFAKHFLSGIIINCIIIYAYMEQIKVACFNGSCSVYTHAHNYCFVLLIFQQNADLLFHPEKPAPLLGDSGGVVNSLVFCLASLKSLGCFYFRCALSSHLKAVTVNLRILHCQL